MDEGLVSFEPGRSSWVWDQAAILSKGYTENVVDLMVEKLRRLPAATQRALRALACFGNTAEAALLASAMAVSEEEVHAQLWEAMRSELIVRSEGS